MSIELKELRLGNWIAISELKKPATVDKKLLSYWCNGGVIDYYSYIELTPKILEKFGFKQDENYHFDITIERYDYMVFSFSKEEFGFGIKYGQTTSYFSHGLKYLHEIQNIIYSLTGVELNDVVSYDYYLKVHKAFYDNKGYNKIMGIFIFEEFLKEISTGNLYTNFPDYKLGDLPPDLWK